MIFFILFNQNQRRQHCFVVKAMPEWWWAEARMDFNRLSTMMRYVDSHISDIVLLSFSTNLYFICIQLLHSFKYLQNIYSKFVNHCVLVAGVVNSNNLYINSFQGYVYVPNVHTYPISLRRVQVSKFQTKSNLIYE